MKNESKMKEKGVYSQNFGLKKHIKNRKIKNSTQMDRSRQFW